MGKKALIRELEAALAQMEQDWRDEHENAGRLARALLRNAAEQIAEQKRHNMIVDAMTAGMRRLTEERDELRLELAGMTSYAALDAAMADIETLTQANEEADATIGDLRERLDAALTEAARMRKEWTGDVEASREIIARKTDENIKLRRDSEDTIMELRDDLARAREQTEIVSACWKRAEDLLQQRERELDALQVQHAEVSEHASQWGALCFRLRNC